MARLASADRTRLRRSRTGLHNHRSRPARNSPHRGDGRLAGGRAAAEGPLNRARFAGYVAAGIATYAAAFVYFSPASWMIPVVARLSGQKLELRAPAGKAWAGTGRLYARRPSGRLTDLGALEWSLVPF